MKSIIGIICQKKLGNFLGSRTCVLAIKKREICCAWRTTSNSIFHCIPLDFSSCLSLANPYPQRGSDKKEIFTLLCQVFNHSFTEKHEVLQCYLCKLSKNTIAAIIGILRPLDLIFF